MSTGAITKLPAKIAALLREIHVCAALDSLAVIKASGSGIRDYLQGQITQDIALLAPDRGIYTVVLTPQGKAVADMHMIEGHNGELIIIAEAAYAEALVGRLRRFTLGYKARIGIVEALAVIAIQGPNTNRALSKAGLPLPASDVNCVASQAYHDIFCMRLPMAASNGAWIITPRIDVASHLELLDHAVTARDMESARIVHGFPRFGVDWDESIHPLNANLIERHGVNFDKGCYVGQEVTSRMHWRGQIKWRLYQVTLDATVSALPCAVEAGGRIGEITSLVRTGDGKSRGIARLRIEAVESGRDLYACNLPVRVVYS